MIVREFPACCGAKILCEFGNTAIAINKTNYTTNKIDDFVCNNTDFYSKHQLFALINQDQYPIVAPILEKYGFIQVRKFLYSGHNNMIYTFIKMPKE